MHEISGMLFLFAALGAFFSFPFLREIKKHASAARTDAGEQRKAELRGWIFAAVFFAGFAIVSFFAALIGIVTDENRRPGRSTAYYESVMRQEISDALERDGFEIVGVSTQRHSPYLHSSVLEKNKQYRYYDVIVSFPPDTDLATVRSALVVVDSCSFGMNAFRDGIIFQEYAICGGRRLELTGGRLYSGFNVVYPTPSPTPAPIPVRTNRPVTGGSFGGSHGEHLTEQYFSAWDYSDPDMFYDDFYDDFDCFEDAEMYWEDHNEKPEWAR